MLLAVVAVAYQVLGQCSAELVRQQAQWVRTFADCQCCSCRPEPCLAAAAAAAGSSCDGVYALVRELRALKAGSHGLES